MITLQGINISHLGKRKIIFKMPFLGGYVSSLEGNSYAVSPHAFVASSTASFTPGTGLRLHLPHLSGGSATNDTPQGKPWRSRGPKNGWADMLG